MPHHSLPQAPGERQQPLEDSQRHVGFEQPHQQAQTDQEQAGKKTDLGRLAGSLTKRIAVDKKSEHG